MNEAPQKPVPDWFDTATSNEAGVVTDTLRLIPAAETARFTTTLNSHIAELYKQGGNTAIERWTPFLEDAARSNNQYLRAVQEGLGDASSALGKLNKVPGSKALSKVGVGPLDIVLGGASVVNDYRNGDNWVSELGKQATSITLSGMAGVAVTGAVAAALGVATTAAAPVIIGGAVAAGVGYGIASGWDYVEENWDDISDWTQEQRDLVADAIIILKDDLLQKMSDAGDTLSEWNQTAQDAFDKWAQDTRDTLSDLAQQAEDAALGLSEDVKQFFREARDSAEETFNGLKQELTQNLETLKEAGLTYLNDAKDWAEGAYDHAVNNLTDFASAGQAWLGDRWNDLRELGEGYSEAASGVYQRVWENGENAGRWVAGQTSDFVGYLRGLFDDAAETRSPIVLDLNGDGVQTTSVILGTQFDHDGNRFAEATGWVSRDDGLLVIDRNADGAIDSGSELFGNYTELGTGENAQHGFEALADLDSNQDGVIDANDPEAANLRVWVDANHDGIAQADEVLTFEQAGVASLSTAFTASDEVDRNGNEHRQQGSYTTTGGATRDMTDVWFQVDSANTHFLDEIDVPFDVSDELPDLAGAGNVMSLHQAMARDPDGPLETALRAYLAADEGPVRDALLIDVIYHWAGVYDVDPLSRAATQIYGNVIGDARKLETLEAVIGEGYVGIWCWGELDVNPHGPAAEILLEAFNEFVDFVRGQLDAQTVFSDDYDLLGLVWDETINSLNIDVTDLIASYQTRFDTDPVEFQLEFQRFTTGLGHSGDYGAATLAALRAAGDSDGTGLAFLLSRAGLPSFTGGAQNDRLTGNADANVLIGLAGNDVLSGRDGDDTIIGGVGNDRLTGGNGGDTYRFELGDGQDTINNFDDDAGSASVDVIRFGAGIAAADVKISRDYFDLILEIDGSTDSIRVTSFLDRGGETAFAIDQVHFADGTVWSTANIMAVLNTPSADDNYIFGTSANDSIDALAGNDNLRLGLGNDTGEGGSGNDFVYGDLGHDSLSGGDNNDRVFGDEGNDTLSGGSGNDTLTGGEGNDTYLIAPGWGNERIDNRASDGQTATDTVVFAAGILSSDLVFRRSSDDLIIRHINGIDTLTVVRHFASADYTMDQIRFSDGTVLDPAAMAALTLVGTSGRDYLSGDGTDQTIAGLEDRDTIYGLGGDDQLSGDAGTDRIFGGDGNDTLEGGADNDTLDGGAGADTYTFGPGWGSDLIRNYEYVASGQNPVDIITFGPGVAASDLTARRVNNDLVIEHANGTDKIVVSSHFLGERYQIGEVHFDDGTSWTLATIAQLVLQATAGNDLLVGGNGDETLSGLAGRDTIIGRDGADSLSGGDDHDRLLGEDGNDTLDGGAGNDRLEGGAGANVYRFDTGWGNDTVSAYDANSVADAIVFGSGIATSDIVARRVGNDLLLNHTNGAESVRVQGHFRDGRYEVATITFADGTSWNAATIRTLVLQGTSGRDTLLGTSANETLTALGDNDLVYGNGGDDSLDGGSGNDRIEGHDGDDTLIGGTGNDYLIGGEGTDTYVFGTGWGDDRIQNSDNTAVPSPDAIMFGAGIGPGDITARRLGNDLFLDHSNGIDSVEVDGHFFSDREAISEVRFDDGTVWSSQDLQNLVLAGTSGADSLRGTALDDTLNGLAGRDTLRGEAGDDSLNGGDDNDTIQGGDGNDTLEGGAGRDTLAGNEGADTYQISDGWGTDYIQNYDAGLATDADIVTFGAGVLPGDISVSRAYNNLVLTDADGGNVLHIQNHFLNDRYGVTEVRFDDGTIWNRAQLQALTLIATDQNDTLVGTENADTLDGLAGRDRILGNGGNDSLQGGADRDTLQGGDGNDTLDGGLGNDTLTGDTGDDTYVFQLGWGNDTINAYDVGAGGSTEVILFGAGIALSDLALSRSGNSLIIERTGSTDRVQVTNHFTSESRAIDEIRLADGTTLTTAQILSAVQSGTPQNDLLVGSDVADTLNGLDGNDTLRGEGGNDSLNGGAGNDTIEGDDGNDTLIGGAGNDSLRGENGGDTYIFAAGWGVDRINNYESTTTAVATLDVIVFAAGIAVSDIRVWRETNDLVLRHTNGTDEVRILSHFSNERQRIDEVRFDDGTVWAPADLLSLAEQASAGNDRIIGSDGADTLDGLAGNDTITGNAGHDELDGSAGNDRISAGDGDDTLNGGEGNDRLEGGSGADVYRFDLGGGSDTISNFERTQVGVDGTDILQFGPGINPGDIQVTRSYTTLDFAHTNGTDKISVSSHYSRVENQLDEVRFDDGTVWSRATFEALARIGSTGADSLIGTDNADTMDGLGDRDTIEGRGGDDLLLGKDGNDRLLGQDGNDTLDPGAGNDYADGGAGDDLYRFGPGWGTDTIRDWDAETNGDIIAFAAGVNTADISVRRSGDDLILAHSNGTDQINVQRHFRNADSEMSEVRFADGTIWSSQQLGALSRAGTNGNDTLIGTSAADTLLGLDGRDSLLGREGDDVLRGNAGNDTLRGEDGADSMNGGLGNDRLIGDAGADRYLFDAGFGQDTVIAYNAAGAADDALVFGAGNAASQFTVGRTSSNSLVLKHANGSDSIEIQNYFSDARYQPGSVWFSDGTVWRYADLYAQSLIADDSDQRMIGTNNADTISSGAGNDRLEGLDGNDLLNGGADRDGLFGQNGNDTLIGGAGNDSLVGGVGEDVYRFDLGWGNDTVNNYEPTPSGQSNPKDIIVFGAGIDAADLTYNETGSSLFISHSNGDSIRINSHRSGERYEVDEFRFADGSKWILDVDGNPIPDAPTVPGTEANDNLTGTTASEWLRGFGGNDWITAGGGNDTVDGGAGNDMVSFSTLGDIAGRTNLNFRLLVDLETGRAESHDGSQKMVLRDVERVTGTIYADSLKGDANANHLRGLGDYDWFIATEGGDTLDGGNGLDMVSFIGWESNNLNLISDVFSTNGAPPSSTQATGVIVDLANPANNSNLAAGQTMNSIERVTGSSRQDVFYGDGGQNDFRGLGDYDWFVSSTGGRERYFGGDGLDTVTYFNAASGVIASLRNGTPVNGQETGYGSGGVAARDLYFEIENLVGSRFDDRLTGSNERNQLNGLDGDDFIFGYGGVDYLMGGAGNDTLNGGASSDYAIFSGNASDYTLSRNGNEVTVSGADGNDLLIDVEYFQFDDDVLNIWGL